MAYHYVQHNNHSIRHRECIYLANGYIGATFTVTMTDETYDGKYRYSVLLNGKIILNHVYYPNLKNVTGKLEILRIVGV